MCDYHSAEITVSTRTGVHPQSTTPITRYTARCRCGWFGPARDRRADADADCLAHDVNENGGGA